MTTAHLVDVENLSAEIAELLYAIPCGRTIQRLESNLTPYSLNASDRIDYLTALDRHDGWLYALRQRAIAAVAGLQPSEGGGPLSGVDESEREDISTALRLAPATAQMRIDTARTFSQLPSSDLFRTGNR
jgi:hypothetical protein